MAEFLTTAGTSHHIEDMIIEAKLNLHLVSPYLQLSKTLYERLKDASKRGVVIKIVYGKRDLALGVQNLLSELNNLELYFFENLHAKCYFNESEMVITSMNMYEFSEKTNREMGILISRNSDKEIYIKAEMETLSMIQYAEKVILTNVEKDTYRKGKTVTSQTNSSKSKGHCIRCKIEIPLDRDKPYCKKCYSESHGFFADSEKVCHSCGKSYPSTLDYPLCNKCYSQEVKFFDRY